MPAPIALFVYRRTDLLQQVLDALEKCPEFSATDVFIFSDGPKTDSAAESVRAVRALVSARLRPNMRLIEAEVNRGLAASIVAGVTQLCQSYGRVIVMEDDLIVSPAILTWFNSALDRYAVDTRVMQISGYMFPCRARRADNRAVFLPIPSTWGWATWQRAWSHFDWNSEGWERLQFDRAMRKRFNLDGAYNYFRMLVRHRRGEVNSWGILWYWAIFCLSGLTLFPAVSFVSNQGIDSMATHSGFAAYIKYFFRLRRRSALAVRQPEFPPEVTEDKKMYKRARWCIRFRKF